jgi:hypothetical protein
MSEEWFEAARFGNLSVVEKLLEKCAEVDAKDNSGKTALMWAALYGHLDIVEKLLDNNADVNAECYVGFTALIWATGHGHFPVLEKLLENGANIEDLVFKIKILKRNVLMINAIKEQRYKLVDKLLVIMDVIDYSLEEKELVKKYLVKRYGNIMTVLWGKYPGFLVFEAIMDNFCPAWKEFLTIQELYELWGKTKQPL